MRPSLPLALLSIVLVALTTGAPAGAATLQDFDSDGAGTSWVPLSLGPPPDCLPRLLAGGPTSAGRFLRLAHGRRLEAGCALAPPDDTDPNSNSVAFERSDAGAFPWVVADFDLRLAPATGRADGVGFALLSTALWGTAGPVGAPATPEVAEEPNFAGSLGIGFDIFESTDLADLDDNHVSIHFDEVRLDEISADGVFDLGGAQWLHVRVLVHAVAGGAEVSVWVTPCGGREVLLVDRSPVPGMAPYEARAYFAARSGGLASDLEIDNVRVQFLAEEPELFSLAGPLLEAVENGGAATVTVRRSSGDASASVGYATGDLTAVAGADYAATGGTLDFAVGELEKTFPVPLLDDDAVEGDERFRVVLASPSAGASLGGPAAAVVEVVDDETARVLGHWSRVECWPMVPIHLHLLPTGKVLAWAREGEGEVAPVAAGSRGGRDKGVGDFDEIRLWDPATSGLETPALPPHDVFCSGHSFLADGRLLVSGGNVADNTGLEEAAIYDPATGAWTPLPLMMGGRWYPTNVTLRNGDVAVESGEIVPGVVNFLPQVFDPRRESWRDLTCAEAERPPIADLYPRLLLAPDGRLFKAGPDRDSWFLDTAGCGDWIAGPLSSPLLEPPMSDPDRPRTYGAAVVRDGEVLLVGGADPPTASVDRIDLNQASPAWRSAGALHLPRRHLNATILADGSVLVTGGTSSSGFNDGASAARLAEVWNPATDSWTALAAMATKRVYHSTAVLLPDGRVLVAGGGQPNAEGDIDHADVEIFSPPYLFNGPRPAIGAAPDVLTYGVPFDVLTPDAAAVAGVTLVRLGSTTHAFDQNQRLVTPSFAPISGGLRIQPPTNPALAPPGHYLLFLLDALGTPSRAHVVRFGFGPIFADGFESGDCSRWSAGAAC